MSAVRNAYLKDRVAVARWRRSSLRLRPALGAGLDGGLSAQVQQMRL